MEQQEEPELDMSPLIDVGFLLLIYFLVATTLAKEEADLTMSLPGTASIAGKAVKVDQMNIRIDEGSRIWVNESLVEEDGSGRAVPNLTDRLRRYAQSAKIAGSDPMIIVECADEAREQRFVDVLNACGRVGIENLSLRQ